jgi:membrane protein DedA with SNARE-associated domain
VTGGAVAFMLLVVGETLFPPAAGPVLPLAGLSVADGSAGLIPTVLLATLASTVGAIVLYEGSMLVGAERVRRAVARHQRWTRLEVEHIERAEAWFRRHADVAVLFGRCVPGLRSLVSIPAGLERMPLVRFVCLTTAGNLLWCSLVIGGAAAFGNHVQVAQRYAAPLQVGVLAFWLIVVVVLAVRCRRSVDIPAGDPILARKLDPPDPRSTDVPT